MMYKAASRAVQAQLNVDGSTKKDLGPDLAGPDLCPGRSWLHDSMQHLVSAGL